uniref:Ig-like domain-containing protein n=1 Tax=Felis catus TaxID=9685 RepID=A0ABI7Z6X1_FELCA
MGSRLLCWVMLCVLGAGPVEAGVTQTPRYLIKARGQQGTLRCSPISGHSSVSWYQQALNQGPQIIFEFFEYAQRTKGNFPDRFSGQQFHDYASELHVSSLEPTDSAVYLCASSLAQPCRVTSLLCTNLPACSNSDRAHRPPPRVHSFQGAFQSFRRPFLHPPELRARPTQNPGSQACTRTEHFHICPHSTRRLSSPG